MNSHCYSSGPSEPLQNGTDAPQTILNKMTHAKCLTYSRCTINALLAFLPASLGCWPAHCVCFTCVVIRYQQPRVSKPAALSLPQAAAAADSCWVVDDSLFIWGGCEIFALPSKHTENLICLFFFPTITKFRKESSSDLTDS